MRLRRRRAPRCGLGRALVAVAGLLLLVLAVALAATDVVHASVVVRSPGARTTPFLGTEDELDDLPLDAKPEVSSLLSSSSSSSVPATDGWTLPATVEHEPEPVPRLCPDAPSVWPESVFEPTARDYSKGELPVRIASFADIHGDYTVLVHLLRLLGLVGTNDECRWIGGKTVVVQTGDWTDRGPHVFYILMLILHLRLQARAAGGDFIVLLGNHEVMNFVKPSASPYMNADEVAAYGPAGMDARVEAFSAEGVFGKFILHSPVMFRLAHYVFAHGAVLPQYAKQGALQTAKEAHRELSTAQDGKLKSDCLSSKHGRLPRDGSSDVVCALHPDVGVIWSRAVLSSDDHNCALLAKALKSYRKLHRDTDNANDVERVLLGHSIQDKGVSAYCGGRLLGMDAGMSGWMNWPDERKETWHRHIGGVVLHPLRKGQPDEVQIVRYKDTGEDTRVRTVERIDVPLQAV